MRADRLEQLFVKRTGAGYELLLVLESDAGARERVSLTAPPSVAATDAAAVGFVVRWLNGRGFGLAQLVRVRVEKSGQLTDAPALRQALVDGVMAERRLEESLERGAGGAARGGGSSRSGGRRN